MDIPEEPKEYFAAQAEEARKHGRHYYGDIVRRIFLGSGILILLSVPLFLRVAMFPLFYALGGAGLFIALAGIASPAAHWTSVLNLLASSVAVLALEWFAQSNYIMNGSGGFEMTIVFWLSHLLALSFAIAFYFSMKTVRWQFLGKRLSD